MASSDIESEDYSGVIKGIQTNQHGKKYNDKYNSGKKGLKTRVEPNPSTSLVDSSSSFEVNVKPLFKFGFSTSWPKFWPKMYVLCKWGCTHDKLKTPGEILSS